METTTDILTEKAALIRKWCLIPTTIAGSGHPTSCLSAADICTVLFDRFFRYDLDEPLNLNNDRIVFSKGHAAPLLYALFGMAGAYPLEDLKTLRQYGSPFEGHPTPNFPYADAATGSLGQGLSVGAGLALAARREHRDNKIFVLLGDGELAEGQVWEAADFAGYYQLDNLIAIADVNRLAQSGETMFGHDVQAYAQRFAAFGFKALTIDGHDLDQIGQVLNEAVNQPSGQPVAIIACTIKGKGVSFVEDKDGWHGKVLNDEQLQKALTEIDADDDSLRFELPKPERCVLPETPHTQISGLPEIDPKKEYATREAFGEALVKVGEKNNAVYVLDGDVKNSTFTEKFMKAFPDRFVECFIAEQNMVSVAVGLSRLGKVPLVATFGAFLSRAADQERMARVSDANIKFVGSHVGVSIGEDGPSQMALEDIAYFGAWPDTVILQPADAVSAAKLTANMIEHRGMTYMRTLRPKTPVIYQFDEEFPIGGCKVLRRSDKDCLTILATGITVPEAIKAADSLRHHAIPVRVIDVYSINPLDKATLLSCLEETVEPILITVEDHFLHGGMGDFVLAALADYEKPHKVIKLGVGKIARSGKSEELLDHAGISACRIVTRVKSLLL